MFGCQPQGQHVCFLGLRREPAFTQRISKIDPVVDLLRVKHGEPLVNRRGAEWQPLLLQGNSQQGERGFIIRLAIEQMTTRLFGLAGTSTVQQLHDVFDVALLRGQAVNALEYEDKKNRAACTARLIIAT